MSGEYERAFRESVTDPERFWGAAAEKVHWYQPMTGCFEGKTAVLPLV